VPDPSAGLPQFLKPTSAEKLFNGLFGILVGAGLGPSYNYLLQVRGRKTGRMFSTPVNVMELPGGKRFLVAPRGRTQWVRNAEASGEIWLKRGSYRQRFRLRALAAQEKAAILKAYLDRYKTAVQRYFPVRAGSSAAEFAPLAENYPVLELIAA
jgi:F420H(2)-dependent quinone reductase